MEKPQDTPQPQRPDNTEKPQYTVHVSRSVKKRVSQAEKDCMEAAEVLAEDPNFLSALHDRDKNDISHFFLRTIRQFEVHEINFTCDKLDTKRPKIFMDDGMFVIESGHHVIDRNGTFIGTLIISKRLDQQGNVCPINFDALQDSPDATEKRAQPAAGDFFIDENGLLMDILCIFTILFLFHLLK